MKAPFGYVFKCHNYSGKTAFYYTFFMFYCVNYMKGYFWRSTCFCFIFVDSTKPRTMRHHSDNEYYVFNNHGHVVLNLRRKPKTSALIYFVNSMSTKQFEHADAELRINDLLL
jgi:hypothetical protein